MRVEVTIFVSSFIVALTNYILLSYYVVIHSMLHSLISKIRQIFAVIRECSTKYVQTKNEITLGLINSSHGANNEIFITRLFYLT